MPSTIQFVPPYSYPEVYSIFTDNTARTTTSSAESDGTYGFLFAIACGKGPDNQVVKVSSETEGYELYGPTNYKLYGQPHIMMREALKSGAGRAFVNVIRVLPDDATYAYNILKCYFKADVANKKFYIKYMLTDNLAPVYTKDEFEAAVDGDPDVASPTDDGWTVVNLLGVRSNGRGKYGQNYRWRVSQDVKVERSYDLKYYNFNVIDTDNGASRLVGSIYGSMAYTSRVVPTVFINDKIIESTEPGKFPAIIYVNEESVDTLYTAYTEFLTAAILPDDPTLTIPDSAQVDFLLGNTIGTTKANPYITILREKTTGVDSQPGYNASNYGEDGEPVLSLDDARGFQLTGGSDGAFDSTDEDARKKAINDCYIKALNGSIPECKAIMSPLRTPTTALFDANYDYEVKQVLRDLAILRGSSVLFIDTGLITSFSDENVDAMINEYSSFMSNTICSDSDGLPTVSINTQWYKIREADTGKRIPVTHTYYILSKLCSHFGQYGYHVPFAQSRAILSGHISNSLQPTIDTWERDLQSKLCDARINYFIATGENQFRRATQCIAQTPESDLIEESHLHVAYYLKNHIEKDARDKLYDFADADERSRFASYVERKYNPIVGSYIQSFGVSFDVSDWELARHIVHGYIDFVFRPLGKQYILSFNVNSRVSSGTDTTTIV